MQLVQIDNLIAELNLSEDAFNAAVNRKYGKARIGLLVAEAEEVIAKLIESKKAKEAQAHAAPKS